MILSGILAVALAALHLAAPEVRRRSWLPEHHQVSFAGGLAVAYVFLHILPALEEHGQTIHSTLPESGALIPLVELAEWTLALAGLVVYLGLELRVVHSSPSTESSERGIYSLQLGAYVLYNVLITYTLATTVGSDLASAIVFAAAMGLHFVNTDRTMERHRPYQFDHRARFVLAGALIVGWVLGVSTENASEHVAGFTSAFLGGAILLNVFKEEIHVDRNTSFPLFLLGATAGVLLFAAISLAEQ